MITKRTLILTNTGLLLAALGAMPAAMAADAVPEKGKAPAAKSGGTTKVQQLVRKAIDYSKESDYFNAVQNFNEALSLDPRSFDSWFGRGWSLRQMGDFAGAIEDYNKAIALQPKRAQVYVNRGWCHNRLNHEDQAMKDFTKAIEIDPAYLNAYKNRGSLKLKMGDYQGAIYDFNQLLSLDPNASKEMAKFVSPAMGALGGNDKADPTKKLMQLAGSLKGTSIKIDETELAQLNNRAARAIKAGEFGNAIQVLEVLAKKNPNYGFARDNLAIAYNNQGLKMAQDKPTESMSQFRRALYYSPNEETTRTNLNAVLQGQGKDPNSDTVRIALGDELEAHGDYQGAFVEYMEAMRLKNSPAARVKLAQVCTHLEDSSAKKASLQQRVKISSAEIIGGGNTPPKVEPAERKQVAAAPKENEASKENDSPKQNDDRDVVSGADMEAQNKKLVRSLSADNEDDNDSEKYNLDVPQTVDALKGADTIASNSSLVSSDGSRFTSDDSLGSSRRTATDAGGGRKNQIAATPSETAEPIELALPPAEPLVPAKKPKIGQDMETLKLEWKTRVTKGDELFEQGNYLDAEGDYRNSLTTARKLGPRSVELASSLERLSRIFLVQKRTLEALSLLEQTYAMRREVLAADDPIVVRTGDKVLGLRHMLYPNKTAKEIKEEEEAEAAADDMPPGSDKSKMTEEQAFRKDFHEILDSRP